MMEPIVPTFHTWATLVLVFATIMLFASERIRVEVTALCVLVTLILLFELIPHSPAPGRPQLDSEELLAGFANPALIAVLALLVLGQGLGRTGALDWLVRWVLRVTGNRSHLAMILCFAAVLFTSPFVNNTPIVVMFIPIMETVARQMNRSPATVMMPLSFVAILGGSATLIGSSTNLLVSGAMTQLGYGPLGFFAPTVPAIVIAAAGLLYLWLVAPRFLRQRISPTARITGGTSRRYAAQLTVIEGSELIGRPVKFDLLGIKGSRLVLLQRGEHSYAQPFGELKVRAGDTLVLLSTREALAEAQTRYPHLLFSMSSADLPENDEERKAWLGADQMLAEVMITPGSRFVGHTLEEAGFRANFGCLVLGMERNAHVRRQRLTDTVLHSGDVLVVQGNADGLERLRSHRGLIVLDGSTRPLPAIRYARLAGLIFAGTVVIAALGILPIVAAALAGVALMLSTRVLTLRQAAQAVDRQIFLMVGASLALGAAMMETGAAAFLAYVMINLLGGAAVPVILSALFLLVAILTNVLTNNATAILMTPIAIGLAHGLGVDPIPFALAVVLGANCSFATPIGYQTNLLVMGPGHYRFGDFIRVGGPLVLLVWIVFSLFAPWYYGL